MNYYVVFDGKEKLTIFNDFDSAADMRKKYISNPSSLVRTFGTLQEAANFAEGLIKPVEHTDKKQKMQEDVKVECTLEILFGGGERGVALIIRRDDKIISAKTDILPDDNHSREEKIEEGVNHARLHGIMHLKVLINDDSLVKFAKGEVRFRNPRSCLTQDRLQKFCKENFEKIDFEYVQE